MSYFDWIKESTTTYYFEKTNNDLLFYPWGNPGQSFSVTKDLKLKFLTFFVFLVFICVAFLFWGIFLAKIQIYTILTALNLGIFFSIFFPYFFIISHKKLFKNCKINYNKTSESRAHDDYKQLMLVQFCLFSFFAFFNYSDFIILLNFFVALIFYPMLLTWIKKSNGNLIKF